MNTLTSAMATPKVMASCCAVLAMETGAARALVGYVGVGPYNRRLGSRLSRHPRGMLEGIHRAVLFLGAITVFSKLVFRTLKAGDAGDASHQRSVHSGG